MRKYTAPQPMTVEYMLSDHLGSTSLTADVNGAKVLEIRYKAWGEIRATWTSSPSTTPAYKMPLYTYTGQAAYLDDPLTSGVTEGFGLMFYQSRFYDPYLNHFVQADTIIPGGVQGLDRYAGMNNNPIIYTDPTGHIAFLAVLANPLVWVAVVAVVVYVAVVTSDPEFQAAANTVATQIGEAVETGISQVAQMGQGKGKAPDPSKQWRNTEATAEGDVGVALSQYCLQNPKACFYIRAFSLLSSIAIVAGALVDPNGDDLVEEELPPVPPVPPTSTPPATGTPTSCPPPQRDCSSSPSDTTKISLTPPTPQPVKRGHWWLEQ
jgi:RHS repeat-associated protein